MPEPLDFTRALFHPKEQFAELYGYAVVSNRLLKIAVLALGLSNVALAGLCAYSVWLSRNVRPQIVPVGQDGKVIAPSRPNDAQIRHFLGTFVTLHYSRVRATLQDDFTKSLNFLDRRLADAATRDTNLASLLAHPDQDIRAVVTNVVLEDMRKEPYRATVVFERQFTSGIGEGRKEPHMAAIEFTLASEVPNDKVLVNPLGLTISYVQIGQGFE